MASPLDGKIRKDVAKAFRGKLLKGTLRRAEAGSGVDEYGDPITTSVVKTWRFDGIRENYTALYREQAGIPDTDVRILIISGSLRTDPGQGDQIYIMQKWHQVRQIEVIDPASATCTLQAFEIKDPSS